MSRCNRCNDRGLVAVRYQQEDGYDVAVCTCQAGQWYRQKGVLKAETDRWEPKPVQIGRYEEFFPAPAKKAAI